MSCFNHSIQFHTYLILIKIISNLIKGENSINNLFIYFLQENEY